MKKIIFLAILILLTISTVALAIVGTQALKLDGKHYVQMKDYKPLNEIKTRLTLETRIRVKEFTNEWMPIVYKGEPKFDCSGRSYSLWVNWHGFAYFSSASKDGFERTINSSPRSIQRNRWYHIACVVDTARRQMLLYLDGQLVNTRMYGKQIQQSRLPLRLGWTYEEKPVCGYFNGWIDEVRIWDCVRSKKQLGAMMKKTLTGKEPNLVGYWPFNESTAKDLTANQAHGELKVGTYQPMKNVKVRSIRQNRIVVNESQNQYRVRRTGGLTDIGGAKTATGKRIKRGLIYRASFQPMALPDQETTNQFKLIIDYRLDDESPLSRNIIQQSNGTEMIRLRFWAYPTRREADKHWHNEQPAIFAQTIRKSSQEIRRTFALLADKHNYPLLYFCSYGIHRATMISSILYLALGVPEESILATSGSMMLKAVFDEIKKSGGIIGYLKSIGVSEKEIERFRQIMLE